jgi:hypothetical protein
MKQFFKKTTDYIIAHVKHILVENKRPGGDIATILMVGDFSDSPLLYKRVKSEGFHWMIRIPRRSPQYQTPYSEHTLTQNCFFQLLEVRPIVP